MFDPSFNIAIFIYVHTYTPSLLKASLSDGLGVHTSFYKFSNFKHLETQAKLYVQNDAKYLLLPILVHK